MTLQDYYMHGFITKCAQAGVSPSALLGSYNPTGAVDVANEKLTKFTPAQIEVIKRILAERAAADPLAGERKKVSPWGTIGVSPETKRNGAQARKFLGNTVRRGVDSVRNGVSAVNGATQKGFEKLMSKYPWMAGVE